MAIIIKGFILKVINKGFDIVREIKCYYVDAYINGVGFSKCIVNLDIIIELILPKIIELLKLKPKPIKDS